MQTFTVKLYQAPRDADWMGKLDQHGRPTPPPKPTALTEFNVQGCNIDAARKAAKKKVVDNRGHRIRSLSCGADDHIHVVVYHPEDATADKP
jgi:hypothetical protein